MFVISREKKLVLRGSYSLIKAINPKKNCKVKLNIRSIVYN